MAHAHGRHRPPAPPHPAPLKAAFTLKPVPLPWRKATGAAVTTGVAMAIGIALGHLVWGVWTFLGAFTSIYVSPEPYRPRAVTLAVTALGLSAAFALASLTAVSWWMTALALGFISLAATFFTVAWRVPLPSALMFILIACIASAMPRDPGETPIRVAFALLGGGLAWLQGTAGWLFHRLKPERTALSDVYKAIAKLIDGLGAPRFANARHAAALQLERAEDAVGARRRQEPDELGRLRHLLDIAEVLFRSVIRAEAADVRPDQAAGARALEIARRVREGAWPDGEPPRLPEPAAGAARHIVHSLNRATRAVDRASPPPTRTVRTGPRPSLLAGAFGRESLAIPTALRIGIAVTVAAVVSHLLGNPHPYWVPLTVAAILQGPSNLVMAERAILRVGGTLVGIGLGALLIGIGPSPVGVLALMMALQFSMLILVVKNYGLSVIFITAIAIVVLYGEIHPPVGPMVSARLADTIIGAFLAFGAIVALLPRAASDRVRPALATALRQQSALFNLLAAPAGERDLTAARERVQSSLLALRRLYDAAVGELADPSDPLSLWPAVVSAERLGFLLVALAPEDLPDIARERRDEIHAVFSGLGRTVRTGQPPRPLHVPGITGLGPLKHALKDLADALSAVDRESASPAVSLNPRTT